MEKKGLAARLLKRAIIAWFTRQGWSVEGRAPEPRKFVVIAAPHTSNWDFLYFIGAADGLNLDLSFVGKKTLFRWPFARLMRDMGGIPVDRTRSTNYVDAMVKEFGRRSEFMLTIAPEGTRGRTSGWKSGFYHIAMGAGVPLVCGFMDYKRKTVGLGMTLWPSGDYEADLKTLFAYYATHTPKFPGRRAVAMSNG